jgi:lipopolysaccharide heptosyltransferase III
MSARAKWYIFVVNNSERRVLVIFPGALGDLMLAMPAIAAIAARDKGASIELMARGELSRLVEGRSVVTRGHSIDRREVTALFAESSVEESASRKFFGQYGRIYSYFAFDYARFRVALAASTDGEVSFHRFRPEGEGHIAAAYLREIEESSDAVGVTPLIELKDEDIVAAKTAIASVGRDESRVVAIFPGSGSQKKNWPVENFVKLAGLVTAEIGRSPIIILGPAEKELSGVFRGAEIPVLEGLELGTVTAIAKMAAGFVGNDSGVSHLAAAAGARGIVLFGPTDPARWRPLGRIEVMRRERIEEIEVEKVVAALRRILEVASS